MNAINTIYFTDDKVRPASNDGSPEMKASSELYVNVNGTPFDWYTNILCKYNTDSNELNTSLEIYDYVYCRNASFAPSYKLRIIAQTSTNNFANYKTYTGSEFTADRKGGGFTCYTKNDSGIDYRKSKYTSYASAAYYAMSLIISDMSYKGTAYKVRVKLQRYAGGSWVDCNKPNSDSVWKEYESYAPFYQAVTVPDHFYFNGINTFPCKIGAAFKSAFTNLKFTGATNFGNTIVVRNADFPFIESGTETNNLYLCPADSSGDGTAYSFDMSLSVPDPSNANVNITVSERTVSGSGEYAQTDDLSMYDISYSLIDTSGMLERYNTAVRPITTTLRLTVNAIARYGAPIYARYYSHDGWKEISFKASQTAIIDIDESPYYGRGHTVMLEVRDRYNFASHVFLDESIYVPFFDYALPTFPTLSIHRCDETGATNDNGSFCRIDWSTYISSINDQNGKKLTIAHPGGIITYDPLNRYADGGSDIIPASPDYSHTITCTLQDDLNTTVKTMRLSTANVIMDWMWNGQGISLGKVAETKDAVEIAENWQFICHKLLLAGININDWMKDIVTRMTAIEQFSNNLSNTNQFQVSFYNGDKLVDRQWIRSGESAVLPTEKQDKESTETQIFAFRGWSSTKDATASEANVEKNITAKKDIYAAFLPSTRFYSVFYYNENEIIKTVDGLTFGSNAAAPSPDPTKDGYTFAGWMPSGYHIYQTEDAKAQFYEDVEITDSWEEIIQACADKTALQKYHLGNYKILETEYGDITMFIKHFKVDKLAGSDKKALISWEGKDCLNLTRRMNPDLEYTTSTKEIDLWVETENYRSSDYPNTRPHHVKSKECYRTDEQIELHATAYAGTGTTKFVIEYSTDYYVSSGGSSNNLLTIVVNGDTKFSGNPGNSRRKSIYIDHSGVTQYTIDVTYTCGSSSNDAINLYFHVPNTGENSGGLEFTGTKLNDTIIDTYTENTGSFGGWEKSELRAWLNNEFYNSIDPIVQRGIKTVEKISLSNKRDPNSDSKIAVVSNAKTHDRIFIPSRQELRGNTDTDTRGIDFKMASAYAYRPVHGYPSIASYIWVRDSYLDPTGIKDQNADMRHTYSIPSYNYMTAGSGYAGRRSGQTNYFAIGFCT